VEGFRTGRVDTVIEPLRGYDGGTIPLYPPLGAPVFSQHGGSIPPQGLAGSVRQFNQGGAVIYSTLDGNDPRALGGAAVPVLGWTATLKARVRSGKEWSALTEAVFAQPVGVPPLAQMEIHGVLDAPDAAEGLGRLCGQGWF
jgi:hypothetical protein